MAACATQRLRAGSTSPDVDCVALPRVRTGSRAARLSTVSPGTRPREEGWVPALLDIRRRLNRFVQRRKQWFERKFMYMLQVEGIVFDLRALKS